MRYQKLSALYVSVGLENTGKSVKIQGLKKKTF